MKIGDTITIKAKVVEVGKNGFLSVVFPNGNIANFFGEDLKGIEDTNYELWCSQQGLKNKNEEEKDIDTLSMTIEPSKFVNEQFFLKINELVKVVNKLKNK